MKFLLFMCVFLLSGFSYSQTFRPFGSNVKSEISVCTDWSSPEKPSGCSNCLEKSTCLKRQTCSIQPYTTEEPVVVACQCQARYSSKHPQYSPSSIFPSWNSNGVNTDTNIAEEEAREGCLDEINRIVGNQNPDHWATSIQCGVRYRYTCEDGSIEMRSYF